MTALLEILTGIGGGITRDLLVAAHLPCSLATFMPSLRLPVRDWLWSDIC